MPYWYNEPAKLKIAYSHMARQLGLSSTPLASHPLSQETLGKWERSASFIGKPGRWLEITASPVNFDLKEGKVTPILEH